MPITLQDALVFTLKWEGGYTNHPLDPGGATNFGIIQTRYNEYLKSKAHAPKAVKHISKAEYEEIKKGNTNYKGAIPNYTPIKRK